MGKYFFPDIFTLATPDCHRELSMKTRKHLIEIQEDKLNKESKRRITKNATLMPRGCAKSTINVKLMLIWALMFTHPRYILIVTATADLAEKHLKWVRDEMESNKQLMDFFNGGRAFQEPGGKWNNQELEVSIMGKKTYIHAIGSGKGIRGTSIGKEAARPDYIIIDDLEDKELTRNKEQRQKLREWFEGDILRLFGTHGFLSIIGTILHQDSLLSNINENPDGAYSDFTVTNYPAILDEGKKTECSLWEDNLPLKWLHDEKQRLIDGGTGHIFYMEYMNIAIDMENQEFKEKKITDNYYKKEDLRGKRYLFKTFCIDLASSKEQQRDFTAFIVLGTDEDGHRYVLEAYKERMSADTIIEKIIKMHKEHRPQVTLIEKGNLKNYLETFLNQRMRDLNYWFTVTPVPHGKTSKEDRIRALVGPMNTDTLHILKEQAHLKDEMVMFPSARNDDLCLVGESKIATPFGDKLLKDIKKGDLVVTPIGLKRVLSKEMTGHIEVIENCGLVGTRKHKMLTRKGLYPLDALSDEISIKLSWKTMLTKLFITKEKNTQDLERDIIIEHLKTERSLLDYIRLFGENIIKKRFPMGIVYIIKMVIGSIMILATLNVYHLANICHIILRKIGEKTGKKKLKHLIRLAKKPLSGMAAKMVRLGIKNTMKNTRISSIQELGIRYAYIVRKNILQRMPLVNFAAHCAQEDLIIRKIKYGKKLNAIPVVKRSLQREEIKGSVQMNAISNFKNENIKPVYNLKIEGAGCYFANGILTSNSDALSIAFKYSVQVKHPKVSCAEISEGCTDNYFKVF